MKVDAALRDKPWRGDMPACVDDTSRAVARANESFVTHSVSLPLKPFQYHFTSVKICGCHIVWN